MTENSPQQPQIRVDIISDVMCPWCIVGFKQLELAMARTGIGAGIRWHPFELNPDMPEDGQDLSEHITGKYGITPEQSRENRARLIALGNDFGFTFTYGPTSRMHNSFRAHQLIEWAEAFDAQHKMKLALFAAHFTEARNVNDIDVLADIATSIGLDGAAARSALLAQTHADSVRTKEQFWTAQGVSGVPAMVFQQKYLVTGAQGIDAYASILTQLQNGEA